MLERRQLLLLSALSGFSSQKCKLRSNERHARRRAVVGGRAVAEKNESTWVEG
jgi:hypothetical protein